MLSEYGKRLIILVTELDTGRERRLTPETDPDLPVRVAVRMSMGVPGLFEPFRYDHHVYCDGGMCNDFPLNALPEGNQRIGLMVRPKEWVLYNLGDLESIFGTSDNDARGQQTIFDEVRRTERRVKEYGVYPVRDALDLMMTSIQAMMDANLALQIRTAQGQMQTQTSSSSVWAFAASLRGAFSSRPPWRFAAETTPFGTNPGVRSAAAKQPRTSNGTSEEVAQPVAASQGEGWIRVVNWRWRESGEDGLKCQERGQLALD